MTFIYSVLNIDEHIDRGFYTFSKCFDEIILVYLKIVLYVNVEREIFSLCSHLLTTTRVSVLVL